MSAQAIARHAADNIRGATSTAAKVYAARRAAALHGSAAAKVDVVRRAAAWGYLRRRAADGARLTVRAAVRAKSQGCAQ
jgi:hypothetical protein